MENLINIIAVIFLCLVFAMAGAIVIGVVRKEPPFKPGTEPKHYWAMTREELQAQRKESEYDPDSDQPSKALT